MFILKKGNQPGVYVPLRALFLVFFSNYLPLQIWTLKICNHISKTITARSFKLGQLI